MIDERRCAALALAILTSYFVPAKALLNLALSGDCYNAYILAVPIICGLLIYVDRSAIFQNCVFAFKSGAPLVLIGVMLCLWARTLQAGTYGLSVSTFGVIVIGIASFLICFGIQALRRAAFPLGFFFLTVPIPMTVMSDIVLELQNGSASFSTILFRLLHVPALREGVRFSLPGVDIEIGEECSGARSVMALGISAILAGHFFIRSWWKQLFLVLLTIPLAMLKNGIRVVIISTLAVYVNRGFLYGNLHRYAGLPLNILELAILTPILIGLHRSERRRQARSTDTRDSGEAKLF